MAQNSPPPDLPKGKIGLAIAAAVAIAAPIAMKWEGYLPQARPDPVGIPTWCFGETEKKLSDDPSYIYSKAECAVLLRARMTQDYAPIIARCLPEIVDNRFIFGALIDAAYNAGPNNVCNSPMARHIRVGSLHLACEALPGWFVTAKDRRTGVRKQFPGLVNRRKDERAACLKGLGK